MNLCKAEYLQKAQQLSEEQQARVLSRMTGKLPKRLHKDYLRVEEALALQLKIEDEHLQEWRENLAKMRNGKHSK